MTISTASPKDRQLQVFLCYASEDKTYVLELYHELEAEGFQPWMDKINLLPGQNWRDEIQKTIKYSDVVIVCLSHYFVTKEGFLHKEIKFALDAAEEKPGGTIYLIPLKFENCDVPNELQHLQWVNYYENGSSISLIRSLKERASKLGLTSPEIFAKTSKVNTLIRLLSSKKAETRQKAIEELGKLADSRAVKQLITLLEDAEEESSVVEETLRALGEIGDKRAIPALATIIANTNDDTIQYFAETALTKLIDWKEIPFLLSLLGNTNYKTSVFAIEELARLGVADAVPTIIENLKDVSPEIREAAATALGKLNATDAIPALIENLKDENIAARKATISALAKLDATDAVPTIIENLKDVSPEIREAAATALRNLNLIEYIPYLAKQLKDEQFVVRSTCVERLSSVLGKDAIPYL